MLKYALTATDPVTGMIYRRSFSNTADLCIAREQYEALGFLTATRTIKPSTLK